MGYCTDTRGHRTAHYVAVRRADAWIRLASEIMPHVTKDSEVSSNMITLKLCRRIRHRYQQVSVALYSHAAHWIPYYMALRRTSHDTFRIQFFLLKK